MIPAKPALRHSGNGLRQLQLKLVPGTRPVEKGDEVKCDASPGFLSPCCEQLIKAKINAMFQYMWVYGVGGRTCTLVCVKCDKIWSA